MGLSKGTVPQIESVNKSSALLILCYAYDWGCLLQHVAAENVGICKPIFVKTMADSIKFETKIVQIKEVNKNTCALDVRQIYYHPRTVRTPKTRGHNHHVTHS